MKRNRAGATRERRAALIPVLALGSQLAALCAHVTVTSADEIAPPPLERVAQYEADEPKSIIELQPFRRSRSIPADNGTGRSGTATLVELNPNVNAWFVLTLAWIDGSAATYHLENPDPQAQRLLLATDQPRGVVIAEGDDNRTCDLWSGESSVLERARVSSLPYVPLCGARLYLRNAVAGRRTELERVTDFLRDQVWGGEAVVGFVRDRFFQDAHLERGTAAAKSSADTPPSSDGPQRALLGEAYAGSAVVPENLGIAVASPASGQLTLGEWYPAANASGVYLSVIQPQAVSNEILKSYPEAFPELDSVEASALDYLIAFDLANFEVGFALGTDHPRLDWSPRATAAVRDDALPGPDGVDTKAPLVTNGMVSPALMERVVATFTGGFKRIHGAFKYGDLAVRNGGSHYGFVEAGAVFSKLQPGLATLYGLEDGALGMKTWSEADDALLPWVRFARQNGVAVVAADPMTGHTQPGVLVNRWGRGNWSGSDQGELRALRAGACLQETPQRRYLIYAYFSTATPSAMARVFQAYGCRYGMHLDMNALEHTYLALYHRRGDGVAIEHLIRGMEALDESVDDEVVPRFTFPDNRDFFYLIRRQNKA